MGCCTAATIDFRFRGKPLRDKLNSPLLKQSEKIPKEIVREIVEKIAVSTATLDDVLAAEWLETGVAGKMPCLRVLAARCTRALHQLHPL
jgi:hypothetical protein